MVRTKTKHTGRAGSKKPTQGSSEPAAPMSELANKGLTEESATVVIRLAEKANRGDVNSRSKLVEFTKTVSTDGEPEANGLGVSQALLWKQEPEWEGESSEATAETASGSREPENSAEQQE
jgi:hypothetical protein